MRCLFCGKKLTQTVSYQETYFSQFNYGEIEKAIWGCRIHCLFVISSINVRSTHFRCIKKSINVRKGNVPKDNIKDFDGLGSFINRGMYF